MRVDTKNWPRYLMLIVVAAATLYFFYRVRDVVIIFLLGGILTYLLYRPVILLESKGIKRSYAMLLFYIFILGFLGLVLYWLIPGMLEEVGNLVEMYPEFAHRAEQITEEIDGISKPAQLDKLLQENMGKIENTLYKSMENFINGIYNFLSRIFILILAPILSFYIIIDWEKIRDGVLNLFSPRFRREIQALAADIDRVLIDDIKGSILVAVIVGSLVGLSALLLGVKFPLLIGLLSGITNLIPYFGPFIGGIPAVAIAYSESYKLAIYQAAAIILVQQVEGNLITPRILGGKLGMHPLLIIFALLAGGSLFGIWGMLFAVPVAAVIKVTISWVYLRFAT